MAEWHWLKLGYVLTPSQIFLDSRLLGNIYGWFTAKSKKHIIVNLRLKLQEAFNIFD